MGGAVSAGRNNDELIDNLVSAKYITSVEIEEVFRAVDRGNYYLEEHREDAYHDVAWRHDHLHISAPCIYSKVMTALDLKQGLSFLNIGSGTGYLNTMVGLLLGTTGINHGIELHEDVVQYAREKVQEYILHSPAFDRYTFCEPEFVIGNGLNLPTDTPLYDRIYCGAACPAEYFSFIKHLLNVDGIMVLPMNEQLKRVIRTKQAEWKVENLLVVNFADLVLPINNSNEEPIFLPVRKPQTLYFLCRAHIRDVLSRKYHSGSNRRYKKRRRRDDVNEPLLNHYNTRRTTQPRESVPNLESGAERISITPAIVSDTESLASEDLDFINDADDFEPPNKRSSILNIATNTITTVGDDDDKSATSSSGNRRSSDQGASGTSRTSTSKDDSSSLSSFRRRIRKSKKKKSSKMKEDGDSNPQPKRPKGWAYIRQKFRNRKNEKSIFSPSAKNPEASSSSAEPNERSDRSASAKLSSEESESGTSYREMDVGSLFIEMAPHLSSPRARQLNSLNNLLRGVSCRLHRGGAVFDNDDYDEDEEFMTDEEIEQPPNKFQDAILNLPLPHSIKEFMLFYRIPN